MRLAAGVRRDRDGVDERQRGEREQRRQPVRLRRPQPAHQLEHAERRDADGCGGEVEQLAGRGDEEGAETVAAEQAVEQRAGVVLLGIEDGAVHPAVEEGRDDDPGQHRRGKGGQLRQVPRQGPQRHDRDHGTGGDHAGATGVQQPRDAAAGSGQRPPRRTAVAQRPCEHAHERQLQRREGHLGRRQAGVADERGVEAHGARRREPDRWRPQRPRQPGHPPGGQRQQRGQEGVRRQRAVVRVDRAVGEPASSAGTAARRRRGRARASARRRRRSPRRSEVAPLVGHDDRRRHPRGEREVDRADQQRRAGRGDVRSRSGGSTAGRSPARCATAIRNSRGSTVGAHRHDVDRRSHLGRRRRRRRRAARRDGAGHQLQPGLAPDAGCARERERQRHQPGLAHARLLVSDELRRERHAEHLAARELRGERALQPAARRTP